MAQTRHLDQITIGPEAPYQVRTIVEVPKGASNKYKYDPVTNTFRYDHTLFMPLYYPYDYGWICGTRGRFDGGPLKTLIIAKNKTFAGCLIVVRPIGTLRISNALGDDPKIVSVAVRDPRLEDVVTLKDISEHARLEIEHFYQTYQGLEQKDVSIEGWMDAEETFELIRTCTAPEPA